MKNWIATAALVGIAATFPEAHSAPIVMGSTTVSFSAAGQAKTIVGTWSANSLDIDWTRVKYFELWFAELSSSFGPIQGLGFENGREITFAAGCVLPIGLSCVGQPSEGATLTLDAVSTAQTHARDFLLRLDPDEGTFRNSGEVTVAFFGGNQFASASGRIQITAFGDGRELPLPPALPLTGTTLLLAYAMTRRLGAPACAKD